MTIKIVKIRPYSASAAFGAELDGKIVGEIRLVRGKRSGQRVVRVRSVGVDRAHQRKGIATKLYEAAARFACDDGRALVSDDRSVGAYSNDFWLKQAFKGRANIDGCSKGAPVFVLRCFAADDLSGPPKRARKRAKR